MILYEIVPHVWICLAHTNHYNQFFALFYSWRRQGMEREQGHELQHRVDVQHPHKQPAGGGDSRHHLQLHAHSAGAGARVRHAGTRGAACRCQWQWQLRGVMRIMMSMRWRMEGRQGVSSCEVSSCEVSSHEVSGCEVSSCEVSSHEVSSCEVSSCEVSSCEVSGREVSGCEVSVGVSSMEGETAAGTVLVRQARPRAGQRTISVRS